MPFINDINHRDQFLSPPPLVAQKTFRSLCWIGEQW